MPDASDLASCSSSKLCALRSSAARWFSNARSSADGRRLLCDLGKAGRLYPSASNQPEAGDPVGRGLGAGVVRLDFVFSKFSRLSKGRLRDRPSGKDGSGRKLGRSSEYQKPSNVSQKCHDFRDRQSQAKKLC
jgi:hypothetical protein